MQNIGQEWDKVGLVAKVSRDRSTRNHKFVFIKMIKMRSRPPLSPPFPKGKEEVSAEVISRGIRPQSFQLCHHVIKWLIYMRTFYAA